MGFKRIAAAASDWRSLTLLGAGIIAAVVLSNPFPAVIGLGLYLWVVQKLAQSPHLQQAAELAEINESLAERYRELQATFQEVAPRLTAISARSWAMNAQSVTHAAMAVYQEWLAKPENDPERARWVDEALRLGHHYLRILRAYQELYMKPAAAIQDTQGVVERLRRNQARLEQTTDMEARSLLIQAIQLDERVLQQEADEAAEAERYLAKLTAIESTLDMLRRRVYQPDAGDDSRGRVHELLLEAAAMDEALEEVQHRARVRAR